MVSEIPDCISVTELENMRVCGDPVVVVDVRSPEEFAAAHITGAINVPLDTIEATAHLLPTDAPIVTACGKGGGRSEQAAVQLRRSGRTTARPLCGGTIAWLEAHAEDPTQE